LSDADIAIIGGGPGGASTGFFLKHMDRKDLRVILIERLEDSRYKRYHCMCGEGISKRAFEHLKPLAVGAVLNNIDTIEMRWPGGVVSRYKDKGYIIDRSAFLKKVLDKYQRSGGEIVYDSVKSVERSKDGFALCLSSGQRLRCEYLVGAGGASSLVRKSLFSEDPPESVVLQQFVIERPARPNVMTFVADSMYNGGYRWEFPFGDRCKIGFPMGTDVIEEEILEKHGRRICFGGLSSIVNGKACLVGDAAGQANPLTMGGIRVAMEAGKQAAKSIIQGNLSAYQRWWEKSGFNSPRFMKAFNRSRDLTNEQLESLIRPFSRFYAYPLHLINYAKSPQDRSLYTSYLTLPLYGW
jgi:flavin-dependent dehydrogenase